MPGAVYLDGPRLSLRTVTAEDTDFLTRYWNRPAFRHWFAKRDPIDRDSVAAIRDGDDSVAFLPCLDGDPVGFLWLFSVDDVNGRAEMGYWIRPERQGEGYATETARLGRRYAFDERGLHKLQARVLAGNDASRRVLEKVGFEQRAHLRDHYYVDGAYVDAYLFGLLAGDR